MQLKTCRRSCPAALLVAVPAAVPAVAAAAVAVVEITATSVPTDSRDASNDVDGLHNIYDLLKLLKSSFKFTI